MRQFQQLTNVSLQNIVFSYYWSIELLPVVEFILNFIIFTCMFQNNAEKLLESHLKFAHPIAGGSNNDNKPEKFPRPELEDLCSENYGRQSDW